MNFISNTICSYAECPAAKETIYKILYSAVFRHGSVLEYVQNYFLDLGVIWNVKANEERLQNHVQKSRQMILKGQIKLIATLPIERAITVAIFGLAATEPCKQIAANARVSKIYAYNYDCRVMESCLVGLAPQLRAKFQLVQLDLSGGLFGCLDSIFSVHKDPKVVRHAYRTLCENAEQISFFQPLPKVDYVICSLLITQLATEIEDAAKIFYMSKFSEPLPLDNRKPFHQRVHRRFLEVLSETVAPGGRVFLSDTWEHKSPNATEYSYFFPIQEELGRFTICEQAKWLYALPLPGTEESFQSSNTVAFLLERPFVLNPT